MARVCPIVNAQETAAMLFYYYECMSPGPGTLGKSLSLFNLPFLHLCNGNNNSSHLIGFFEE